MDKSLPVPSLQLSPPERFQIQKTPKTFAETRQKIMASLSRAETKAYDDFLGTPREEMPPALIQKCYELFLHGQTCEQIQGMLPHLPLGQIIQARIVHNWDQNRCDYVQQLLDQSAQQLQKTATESLQFLTLLLTAAHQEHGEAIKQYLLSGNSEDLGDFRIKNLKSYQQTLEILLKLTGGDNKKQVDHHIWAMGGTTGAEESTQDQTKIDKAKAQSLLIGLANK
jgi:hypothetical protein